MGEIAKFIVFIGPISSIFDYTTYLPHVVCVQMQPTGPAAVAGVGRPFPRDGRPNHTYAAALFHTGWFVESS